MATRRRVIQDDGVSGRGRIASFAGRGLVVGAWIVTGLLALVVAMRLAWHDGLWLFLLANTLTPYLYLPAWAIAVGAVASRRWRLAIAAGILCAFHAHFTLLPLVRATHRPPQGPGPTLKVVSANLLMVHQNPPALADELDRLDADVYFLQELSDRWDRELERRGFWKRYPYNRRVVSEDSFGSAIASRLPVSELDVFWLAELPEMRGVLSFNGRSIELFNFHLLPPRSREYVPYFQTGVDGVLATARQLRARGGSFIIAGDFNSTPDSRLAAGMRAVSDDAWEIAGAGFGATWPNGVFPVPPIRLDHVFLSPDLAVSHVTLGTGTGSDHLPIIADIVRQR